MPTQSADWVILYPTTDQWIKSVSTCVVTGMCAFYFTFFRNGLTADRLEAQLEKLRLAQGRAGHGGKNRNESLLTKYLTPEGALSPFSTLTTVQRLTMVLKSQLSRKPKLTLSGWRVIMFKFVVINRWTSHHLAFFFFWKENC